MFETVDLQVELPRIDGTPRLARWVIRSWCTGRIDANALAEAQLMVTELTTNAVSHGQGHITLHVYLDEDHLFVQVIDHGGTSSASYSTATGAPRRSSDISGTSSKASPSWACTN
jgi:anti-sigma regulatory factor (Ser/Thr protein kinase)